MSGNRGIGFISQLSVAPCAFGSSPLPALIRVALVNFFPKAIFYGARMAQPVMVTGYKTNRLPFDVASLKGCILGYGGELPTPAVAVAVGDFIRGFVRGMIGHAKFSFQNLAVPRAVGSSAVVSLLA